MIPLDPPSGRGERTATSLVLKAREATLLLVPGAEHVGLPGRGVVGELFILGREPVLIVDDDPLVSVFLPQSLGLPPLLNDFSPASGSHSMRCQWNPYV